MLDRNEKPNKYIYVENNILGKGKYRKASSIYSQNKVENIVEFNKENMCCAFL